MNASSRHLSQVAVAGLICLSAIAYAQPPDPNQDLTRKERKQLRQQERQGGGGQQGGQPNIPSQGQSIKPGPGMQGAPVIQSNPNLNQGGSSQQLKHNDDVNKNLNKQLKKSGQGEIQVEGNPDLTKFKVNPSDGGGQGGNKKKNQGQNQNMGQTGNTPPSPNVTPSIHVDENLSKKELNKQKQQQNHLEEQANKQNKKNKTPGDEAVVSPKATPFVPDGTPPAGGSRLEQGLSKKEQNKLDNEAKKEQNQLEQQAKKEQNQQEQQAKKDQKELEKLQKKGLATPGPGEATPAGQIDLTGKGKGKKGQDANQALAAPVDPNAAPALSKHDLKKQMKDSKQAEQEVNKAAKQFAQLEKKNEKIDLKKLSGAEKAMLVGADASQLQVDNSKKLSKKNSINIIGDNNTVIKNKYVDKDVIYKNHGYPDHWDHNGHHNDHDDHDDWWHYAAVLSPLINLGLNCVSCLPAVPVVGVGYGNLDWNYWDGRSYYDHGYCDSIFTGIGHYRYNGCDGVVAGGRYYCYGYGWMSGCIDYGESRIWCPGFWAPYTVEECGNVPIWIPPVYEEVWTGCCWETVQVDGGYFGPSPSLDCHLVTRYTWVPGHFEFYYV